MRFNESIVEGRLAIAEIVVGLSFPAFCVEIDSGGDHSLAVIGHSCESHAVGINNTAQADEIICKPRVISDPVRKNDRDTIIKCTSSIDGGDEVRGCADAARPDPMSCHRQQKLGAFEAEDAGRFWKLEIVTDRNGNTAEVEVEHRQIRAQGEEGFRRWENMGFT